MITANEIFKKEREAKNNCVTFYANTGRQTNNLFETWRSWRAVAEAVRAGVDPTIAVLNREVPPITSTAYRECWTILTMHIRGLITFNED